VLAPRSGRLGDGITRLATRSDQAGSALSRPSVAFPARVGAKTVLVLPVKLSLARAGQAFGQIVRGHPVDATVRGEANLGGFAAPVGFEGKVSPTR